MDIRTHLRLIWRKRIQVVGLSVLIAGLVFVLVSGRPDRYAADARLQVVAETRSGSPAERATFLANGYAELARTAPVLELAAANSGLDIDVSDARSMTGASAPDDLGFVVITAEADTAAEAEALVAALVSALTETIDERSAAQYQARLQPLESRIAELRDQIAAADPESSEAAVLVSELDAVVATRSNLSSEPVDRVVVVEPPFADDEPIPAGTVGTTITAFLVALILNAELAVGLHLLADRLFVDEPDEVEAVTGLPVLASISVRDSRAAAEAFRQLRLRLSLHSAEPVGRLAVVGTGAGSSRADVSIGIAEAAADLGVAVTLVDADLRTPSVHERFDLSRDPGLGDLPEDGCVDGLIRSVPGEEYLRIVTAGAPPDDPGRFIAFHLEDAIARLSEGATLVVNTPDADEWSDGAAVAKLAEATIVVVTGGARRRGTRLLVERLRSSGARPIGVVVHTGTR